MNTVFSKSMVSNEDSSDTVLSTREPLEAPLHPKPKLRRRYTLKHTRRTAAYSVSSAKPPASRSRELVKQSMIDEDSNDTTGAPLETPLHTKPKRRRRNSPAPTRRTAVEPSPEPEASSQELDKQSTSRGSGSSPLVPGRSQPDEQDTIFNIGSEDETDDETEEIDGEFTLPRFVSRVERFYYEAAVLDKDDDDNVPSSVQKAHNDLRLKTQAISETVHVELPMEMFKFDWRPCPNPPVNPTKRRHVFSIKKCGPTTPLSTPYDAFVAIWDRDIMKHIAKETNRYAQEVVENQIRAGTLAPRSRIVDWQDTDVDELYVFFALMLATGYVIKSELSEYWIQDDFSETPHFGLYMSRLRYELLSRCLHFADNSTFDPTLSRSNAKTFKIQPIISHLNSKFQSLYQLDQNIAIDESLTQWKGLLDIKQQSIKNQVASVGVKTYEVCESQTGYLWRFKVYAGREEDAERETTPVSGVIPSLVLELLEGLEHKGHTVWMDNYYNSPPLARLLKTRGFDCVGTLRTNRQGVPSEITSLHKSEMRVGEVASCTAGDVDIVVWRDQNLVPMITTYHGATTARGSTKPTVICDYNVCMGGVDKRDQMLSMYPIERKRTHIWYKKLFRRLLNTSVLNAYILCKHSNIPDRYRHVLQHRQFRRSLIKDLLARHKHRPAPPGSAPASQVFNIIDRHNQPREPHIKVCLNAETLTHFPEEYECEPGTNRRYRRRCAVCHRRVQYYCPACKVALCVVGCAKKYHT